MDQPLSDIRVIDVSRVLAGPYCSMLLGDMGADVIKIEPPGRGDDSRHFGPPFVGTESSYYLSLNRNKRSVTLDITTPRGKDILLQLLDSADVLVENWLPRVSRKLGLPDDDLRARNPRLVHANISGFGTHGPYADRPGYDVLVQGMAGIMSVTGEPDGRAMRVGVAIADISCGMFAVQGILAALRLRDHTGQGQFVATSLIQSQIAWLVYIASGYLTAGVMPERLGNAHPSIVPYQSFPAADGEFILAVGNDVQWSRLCAAIETQALEADPRFATNPDRITNRRELIPLLEDVFRARPVAAWLEVLGAAGIPCAPINDMAQLFADPQVLALEMIREVPHPTLGSVKLTGFPVDFADTPSTIRRHPPLLGEHTDEVLTSLLNLTPSDLASLRADGVI